MKTNQLFIGAFGLLLVSTMACSGNNGARPASERPAVAVEAARAEAGVWEDGVAVTGTLAPKYEVAVKSEVMGLVREVYVTEWVRVKKGTLLARIDSRELEATVAKAEAALESARANALQAQAADNRARRELERMKKLKESGLATRQSLDDAETEAEASAARVGAAQAQIRVAAGDVRQAKTHISKCLIVSPIDGVVSLRKVSPGDLVGETGTDKTLFHVVDNRILNLTANVPSTEMAALRPGQSLAFSTDAFPGKTFTGKVKFVNPSVNDADRSVKVIAEVPNHPEVLKGGLFTAGRIITGRRDGVVRVARAALMNWDVTSRKAGLLIADGERAVLKTVKTGSASGDGVEISEGLKPGEWVILRGGFNVKDGDRLMVTRKERGAQ